MTIHERVRQELARLAPTAPSVRSMARVLGVSRPSVARAYRALGVASAARPGRPPAPVFAEASVPVNLRIPGPIYDHYSRVATARHMPVLSLIRAQLVACARLPRS